MRSHLWRAGRGAAVTLALAGPSFACNLHKMTADMTSGPVRVGSIVLDRESDLIFAEQAMPGSLKTVESLLANSPENPDLLFVLSRGYNAYALGFVERELEKARIEGTQDQVDSLTRRAVLHYLRGRDYGFRVLDRPDLEKAARAGELAAVDVGLKALTPEEAPALFWTVYGWAGATNLDQSNPDTVAALPVIERLIARAVELDPHYEFSSPLLLQAVYQAGKPAIAGGNPDQARDSFDRAMKAHGQQNLLIPYMYARFYCVMVQDRQLFDSLVSQVLEADVTKTPDLRLLNEIARDLARFWAARADELILE